MSIIHDRLTQLGREFDEVAEIIGQLERERDWYRAQAIRWAELVDRQRCSYAERVQLEAMDNEAARLAEREIQAVMGEPGTAKRAGLYD